MSPLPDRRPAQLLRGLLTGLAAAGLFLGGASPCWADTYLAGVLWSFRTALGEDDESWKAIAEAQGGVWGAYIQEFEKRGWLKVV